MPAANRFSVSCSLSVTFSYFQKPLIFNGLLLVYSKLTHSLAEKIRLAKSEGKLNKLSPLIFAPAANRKFHPDGEKPFRDWDANDLKRCARNVECAVDFTN